MKNTQLKIIRNEFKTEGISDIIGRDAKEVLKRNPIVETEQEKEKNRIDFRNKGIKFLYSLIRF